MGGSTVPFHRLAASEAALLDPPPPNSKPTLPVQNPTKSFWETHGSNPLATHGSTGALTDIVDVVIIGSGLSGVSAAYHMATQLAAEGVQQSVKIVILEARDFCCGATGRNGGHLTPNGLEGFTTTQERVGSDEAVRNVLLERHTASSIVKVIESNGLEEKTNLSKTGHMTIFLTPEEEAARRKDLENAQAAGVLFPNAQWLKKEELDEKYGSPHSAFLLKEAHTLWPLRLVTELFRLAQGASSTKCQVSLHTHTPVTSFWRSTGGSWSIHTPRGIIRTKYVLHATNAYTAFLLPQLHGPAGIIPTRGHVISTRYPHPATHSFDANDGFEYWFPVKIPTDSVVIRGKAQEKEDELIVIGGARELSSTFDLYNSDDSSTDDRVVNALKGFLPTVFPNGAATSGKVDGDQRSWSGIMGYTSTGDPFVGRVKAPEYEGHFISAGFTGHGMPRTFGCAEVVGSMLVAELTGKAWTGVPEWCPKRYIGLS